MNYENYQLEDFLGDKHFIEWVVNPDITHATFWNQWILEHPDKVQVIELAKHIVLFTRYKHEYQPTESEVLEVLENIQKGKRSGSRVPLLSGSILPQVMRYAAVLFLVTGVSWLIWNYHRSEEPVPTVASQPTLKQVDRKAEKGEKLRLRLPDGSHVVLNAESKIVYFSDFGKDERKLELEGEAFFDVKHDASKPFIIKTGTLETTVLGTSFNVQAYREEGEIKVAVLTGKVRVRPMTERTKGEETILTSSEMVTYQKDDGTIRKEQVEIKNRVAWKDNTLLLKNASFEEIRSTIERWYSVTFVVENGLDVTEEFSAKFENAPLQKVLDALNYTSRFQYELIKDKVYVKRKDEE
jgi:transmembrane sensor